MAYGAAVALDGVSMDVPPGSIVAVTGPNGAGKTSLLRAISGLLGFHGGRLTSGSVEVGGARVGYVLEGRRVFRPLTVEDNLRAGAFPVRDRAVARARVAWAFERFALLAARRAVPAGELSGGEQQLLALATAMVPSPHVLLLDEPTVGLSQEAIELVERVVAEVAGAGAVVVVAEQEQVLATTVPAVRLGEGRALAAT